MNIIIKATNFTLTPAIEEEISEKLGSIEKYIPANTEPLELRVEVALTTKHHQKGDIFRAEANLRIHDDIIRVESDKEELIMAITDVKDELQESIKRYKGKQDDAARGAKEEMHKMIEEMEEEE